jgi:hypothetical protein
MKSSTVKDVVSRSVELRVNRATLAGQLDAQIRRLASREPQSEAGAGVLDRPSKTVNTRLKTICRRLVTLAEITISTRRPVARPTDTPSLRRRVTDLIAAIPATGLL